ncbi:HutD/Ves family protein [Paraburkholderia terricola]|uniref:Environmental stress-induced protein Ves n=1 Tax=Paraburkholderia terricola TaxID=169427 RepID=A0ABU1M033_9BURK|nr:HutD family protein [Paraburkholderia terricola]MDR6412363.1 environmental stress-induced protein Ves [Paraburkholderia terricola]MDR6449929.1 environmental stress-induced protein Ves [Paraburkholderia terricola]MDR6484572.1 environmental stress-induced protein Ves [Paraburkholderia terricola]
MASALFPERKAMYSLQLKAIAEIPSESWRNGGGVTRSLAQSGEQWRVSLAELQNDGAYSRFEGISRVSLVLRGTGVELEDGDRVVMLKPAEAVEYDGAPAWQATLIGGPVTALNVMTAKSGPKARVGVVVSPTSVPPDCVAIIVALDGGCSVSGLAEESCIVEPGHVVVIDDIRTPFTVSPIFKTSTESGCVKLPVLVTITSVGSQSKV